MAYLNGDSHAAVERDAGGGRETIIAFGVALCSTNYTGLRTVSALFCYSKQNKLHLHVKSGHTVQFFVHQNVLEPLYVGLVAITLINRNF